MMEGKYTSSGEHAIEYSCTPEIRVINQCYHNQSNKKRKIKESSCMRRMIDKNNTNSKN